MNIYAAHTHGEHPTGVALAPPALTAADGEKLYMGAAVVADGQAVLDYVTPSDQPTTGPTTTLCGRIQAITVTALRAGLVPTGKQITIIVSYGTGLDKTVVLTQTGQSISWSAVAGGDVLAACVFVAVSVGGGSAARIHYTYYTASSS